MELMKGDDFALGDKPLRWASLRRTKKAFR